MIAQRRVAIAVTVVATGVFVLLAALLVPWSPVPGGTPDPVPVGDVLTSTEVARAEQFTGVLRRWGWAATAVNLLVVVLLALSARVRRWAGRLPGPWWVQVLLAVAGVELVARVATLTFSVLSRRHVRAAGLSDQAWTGFARDLVVAEALDIVVTGLLALVVVGCARRWRRAWPAVVAGLAAGLVVAGSFAYPLVVEPLFNDFAPLPDGDLRTGVLELAEAEGVPVDEVLVADASRRTTTLNAYVSGFAGSRRVVLYDNLVRDVPRDEALSVVAHELAHARHDDVLVGTVLGASGAAAAVGLLGLVLGRRRADDPATVPTLVALLAVGSLLALPVQNGISRTIELRADVEALRVTEDPEAFVDLQRRLALRSLADPTPPAWSHWWFGSHPTLLVRVALARS
ncbi:M48 family metallopeptidase [Nocardioides sp.]|uniref:M48 family metallopeptidase n=1 Tax=Nocardioides sp. TaxID=35761 RepID=UPI00351363FD